MDQNGGLEVSSSNEGGISGGGGCSGSGMGIGGDVGGQPTQITSIDGFFNRKRGRPPKNRFVEVYKSAQHSPQAIFTSFKLERNEQQQSVGSSGILMPGESHLEDQVNHSDLTTATSRNRKRCRAANATSPIETTRNLMQTVAACENERQLQGLNKDSSKESRSMMQPMSPTLVIAPSKKTSCRILERVSVVRAAGTFYPENASSSSHNMEETTISMADQPEDLSMRPSASPAMEPCETSTATAPTSSHLQLQQGGAGAGGGGAVSTLPSGLNLVQFKQLIDLYQRQVLLPSFLAAASQQQHGPTMDMRLLLENAAQQKLMLINAAAATAAAAAAAAAAASAASTTTTPTTLSNISDNQVSRPMSKRTRVEDIPTGYLKFRFNEDCTFEQCGYRNHQSHFHCNRRDCHYSFCDKTRFVQHTARHERMDTLMGDDFQQYRANMQCGISNCCYGTVSEDSTDAAIPKKSSHFHCRKCDYVCTDSNKVVAHRRLHLRLEYVRAAGFRKVASNEICDSLATCSYALRHTHYHCVTCDGSVLSRAQLASHKHRTMAANTISSSTTTLTNAKELVEDSGPKAHADADIDVETEVSEASSNCQQMAI